MKSEGNMAEPVRNDDPLSSMRFPESSPKRGPERVPRSEEDVAGYLPEEATDKPLGEWTPESLEDLRDSRHARVREARAMRRARLPELAPETSKVDSVKSKIRQVTAFWQNRASDVRHRFEVIRGRVRSGDLQSEWKSRASDLGDKASDRAQDARNRAEYYARNYPLQFIGGAAAAGFVMGFLLRMWRDE
jgi:ElaB/YqjD/DUF883 family membrane-anchored ribosome-binding protein